MVQFVQFPDVANASKEGLLATGGELSTDMLVSAYAQGIFPWFNKDQPLLWWSPDPRLVLYPNQVKISRSLNKKIRQGLFKVTINLAFDDVISACALRGKPQPDDHAQAEDTWITNDMLKAYQKLHQQGFAHSLEVWHENHLVGGLYGLVLGDVFFGESMFSRVSDASKVALVRLCNWMVHRNFKLIDCQVYSDHLASLGATQIPRTVFLENLKECKLTPNIDFFSKEFNSFTPDNDINRS